MRTLADVGIITPYSVAAPAGRGPPAQLYVSEALPGLAGSSRVRL